MTCPTAFCGLRVLAKSNKPDHLIKRKVDTVAAGEPRSATVARLLQAARWAPNLPSDLVETSRRQRRLIAVDFDEAHADERLQIGRIRGA